MLNIISPILGFIFVFSIIALMRLGINFVRAIMSTPPKPFEMGKMETLMYGIFVSYIITYIIY